MKSETTTVYDEACLTAKDIFSYVLSDLHINTENTENIEWLISYYKKSKEILRRALFVDVFYSAVIAFIVFFVCMHW